MPAILWPYNQLKLTGGTKISLMNTEQVLNLGDRITVSNFNSYFRATMAGIDLTEWLNNDGTFKSGINDGDTLLTTESGATLRRYGTAMRWYNASSGGQQIINLDYIRATPSSGIIRLPFFKLDGVANNAISSNDPWYSRIENGEDVIYCGTVGRIFTAQNYLLSDLAYQPVYNWSPFDSLRGNGGQYRCKLTMINADKIGDFTTPIVTSDRDDFDRISEQASLLSYFQNAPLGVPVTVAWSGDNWLTMTATKNPEPDTKDYLLNLQFRYALTESIIYSYNGRIQLEDYRHIPYLSFIVDDDQEFAVFDCVTYYSASQSDPDPHWGYLGRSQTDAAMHALWLWLQDSLGDPESESPYNSGTSDNGGEGGNPIPQDDMPRPALPSLDAANLGFFTVYNFTASDETQLQDIADFLWSDNVLDNFKKYFNNFSDNIFALYILPYTPATLPTKNFKVGRMESEDITGVKYLSSRYVDLPMGEVRVDPRWTSYIDYAPYTRFELYLPGIGIHSIDADDIMSPADRNGVLNTEQGSLISIKYTLDLFTGIVVAFVFIDGQMRYQYSGKVGQTIPITGENYSSMVSTFISGAASLVSTIASGGLSAPLAGAAVAGTIAAQKPEVYRSGNMLGDVSLMSEKTPYLIRHVPNKPEIIEQEKFTGFPSYKTGKVRDFGGYLEALEIHVEELNCCEEERDKIRSLFKSGVIL